MEITIKGNPKEIADLVSSIQNRQLEIESPLNLVSEAFESAICDTGEEQPTEI